MAAAPAVPMSLGTPVATILGGQGLHDRAPPASWCHAEMCSNGRSQVVGSTRIPWTAMAAVTAACITNRKRSGVWVVQRRSLKMTTVEADVDLTVEPLKLKRGVLPNGMRYVVLRHLVPKGRFEAHLEFHVGSVDEQEDQRGMAHMLEHICFLGSEKRMQLQSGGLGMTSNACTDFNHTVYYVSIGSEHLSGGLQVLADVGFQPAFKPERVEKERAAVLSEAQMVNDCQYRLQTQFLSALHDDNCIHTRFPIGLEQQIASWSVEELRKFHSRWYVPENATLFIVGDIDEEETIREVENSFSSIPKAGLSIGDPWQYDANSLLRPVVEGRPEILHRFVQAAEVPGDSVPSWKEWRDDLKISVATNDLMQGMQVTWAAKMPLSNARSLQGLSDWLCQRLVVEAVRLRFSSRWRSGVIPCSLHSYDSAREAVTITTLTIMAEPSRWQDRCEEVLQEVLTITRHGVAEDELDLAKRMCLDRVAEAAASQPWSFMGTLYGHDAAGTSREVVEALIASTPADHLLTSAPSFNEALQQVAKEIDLPTFNASLRSMLSFLGPAENACSTVIVSCPASVADELNGRKVPFGQPSAEEVERVLRNVKELDAGEAASRRVSAPASLAPEVDEIPEVLELVRGDSVQDVTTLRLANGLLVRLLVMPASPSSGPARAGMRLTVPGGRANDDLAGRFGASESMLMALNNGGAGQWSQDEVQLFRALNSLQTDFRAGADALELDVFMSPNVTSCRAALEWLHWTLKDPKLDLQGFADSQLRMKGDALAREKSLEKRSLQAALEHMYPSHRWLDEVQVQDVNRLTLGMAKKAAASQMQSVEGLELDIAVCIARLGDSGGLMHEEEFEGASESAEEEEAVKEMRKTLEVEIRRCLGTLPAQPREAFSPPTPSASSRGTELRVHIPDNEARAMVLVGGFAPGYWGRGDKTWQTTTQYKNFSWGPRAENPLYPARATELMMECMNTRLLGRVRDQLSLAYNCDIELTMFEGFDAGHFFCKVFTFPQTLREAAAAAVQVLRSPGWLPFTDMEVEASKKVMSWREGRRQREDRSYWFGRLKPLPGGASTRDEESKLLECLGADDVQLAWRALGGLDDPTVVLTTSGTPDVAAILRPQDLPVVEHSDFPEAVAAQEALAPKKTSTMDFLD